MNFLKIAGAFVCGLVIAFLILSSPTPASFTPVASPEIVVSEPSIIWLENLLDSSTFSWKALFQNPDKVSHRFTARIQFLDASGFKFDESINTDLVLSAGESQVYSAKGIMKTALSERIAKYQVVAEIRD